MKIHPLVKRAASAATIVLMASVTPEALKAACINKYNPITGIQTITCCGATACCTTTWRGSELIELVCE